MEKHMLKVILEYGDLVLYGLKDLHCCTELVVTRPDKTGLIALFCISKNTDLNC